jgi:hypothetical protein
MKEGLKAKTFRALLLAFPSPQLPSGGILPQDLSFIFGVWQITLADCSHWSGEFLAIDAHPPCFS